METAARTNPLCLEADAKSVVLKLREAGHVAYFAGGCVRDILMGQTPKDYDVATDAEPAKVRKIFPQTQAVGAAFGVILVRHGKSVVEVATFRTDGPYSDGRRPDAVKFASAQDDAQRRDFTINGLFLDPVTNEVIDYVGGRADLEQRRLRAIGDAGRRFEEDHLRLLRAVRFAARFDLEIEPATAQAIIRAAPRLKGISPERIAEELRLILTPLTRRRAWPLLAQMQLTPVIFRLLPLEPAGREIFLNLTPQEAIPFPLSLAAAALEVSLGPDADPRPLLQKSEARRIVAALRKSLKISNDESDALEGTLAGLSPLLSKTPPTVAIKKRFLAQPTSPLSRKLLSALAACGCFTDRAAALAAEFTELEKTEFAPPPLLTGDDLTAAGLPPGPEFKRLLDSVYDAQLEGRIRTTEKALELALQSRGEGSNSSNREDAKNAKKKF
ncbi:MAG: CCA tRNA nucleotidyltransferase [Tepidisphaeraceae bacterium]